MASGTWSRPPLSKKASNSTAYQRSRSSTIQPCSCSDSARRAGGVSKRSGHSFMDRFPPPCRTDRAGFLFAVGQSMLDSKPLLGDDHLRLLHNTMYVGREQDAC